MYRISCSEVWGGIRNEDVDACSAALTTSLYSQSCDGGKGGDIYYFSVCQGDMQTRVALADVVGHGERVSRVSQWLYQSLVERMNAGDGNEVLAELNQLAVDQGLQALTTAAVIGFHTGGTEAHFCYAGHHPMLIRHAAARSWEPVLLEDSSSRAANLPLGIDGRMQYDQQAFPMRSGDRALLYTDGVTETPAPSGELFGESRLRALLDEFGDGSLYELKTTILSKLREFAGGELSHDDVTLLALEVR